MKETKAIILCGNKIALPVLRNLFFSQQLSVIVIPENCSGFAQQVRQILKGSGIPVVTVNKEDYAGKLQELISKYAPAIGLLFTFPYKLPAAVYTMPPKGFFNIHPGPLPGYRGPDPVFRQIANREKYAAVTIHKLDDGFDTGSLVLSDKIHLGVTDTYGILTTKLGELAARLAGTLMKMAGFEMNIPSRPQDTSNARYYQRQGAADITINWPAMDAVTIIALINACNPWNKGAATELNGNIIRLLEACEVAIGSAPGILPGTILSIDESGMNVAVAKQQAIRVRMISNDEGFLLAGRLTEMAVIPGTRLGTL